MDKLRIVSLFSGIGSFEHALSRMGKSVEVVLASDIDKFVKQSYEANYEANEWISDVCEINGTKYKDIDFLVGGSPCQSFSVLGERAGLESKKGLLVFEYIRLVEDIQPRCFIYEDVSAITQDKKQWRYIFDKFSKLGYTLRLEVLKAEHFDIPQSRKRLFVVGFRNKKEGELFDFPTPRELTSTMQDFLEDNSTIDAKYILSDKKYKKVTAVGVRYENAATDLKKARTITTRNDGYRHARECNYITVGENKLRVLIPIEALRLMGFSDTFKVVVSDVQIFKQIGNSIVVNVLEALFEKIFEVFDANR